MHHICDAQRRRRRYAASASMACVLGWPGGNAARARGGRETELGLRDGETHTHTQKRECVRDTAQSGDDVISHTQRYPRHQQATARSGPALPCRRQDAPDRASIHWLLVAHHDSTRPHAHTPTCSHPLSKPLAPRGTPQRSTAPRPPEAVSSQQPAASKHRAVNARRPPAEPSAACNQHLQAPCPSAHGRPDGGSWHGGRRTAPAATALCATLPQSNVIAGCLLHHQCALSDSLRLFEINARLAPRAPRPAAASPLVHGSWSVMATAIVSRMAVKRQAPLTTPPPQQPAASPAAAPDAPDALRGSWTRAQRPLRLERPFLCSSPLRPLHSFPYVQAHLHHRLPLYQGPSLDPASHQPPEHCARAVSRRLLLCAAHDCVLSCLHSPRCLHGCTAGGLLLAAHS